MMAAEESTVVSFSYQTQAVSSYADINAAHTFSTSRTSGLSIAKHSQPDNRKVRIKRKLVGFLRYFEGNRARVVFDCGNDNPIEYYLSADLLSENGVTVPQQPFELIEAVRFLSETESEHFTKIKPLAPASSAQIRPLDLPEETREDIQYIYRKLKSKS